MLLATLCRRRMMLVKSATTAAQPRSRRTLADARLELDCPFCSSERIFPAPELERHVAWEHGSEGHRPAHYTASYNRSVQRLRAALRRESGRPGVVVAVDLANSSNTDLRRMTASLSGDEGVRKIAAAYPLHFVVMWELFMPLTNAFAADIAEVAAGSPHCSFTVAYAPSHPEAGDFALSRIVNDAVLLGGGGGGADVRVLSVTNDQQLIDSLSSLLGAHLYRNVRGVHFADFSHRFKFDVLSLLE